MRSNTETNIKQITLIWEVTMNNEIIVYNLVFTQRDTDLHEAHKQINKSLPKAKRYRYYKDISDSDLIDYLMQWHMDDLSCYDSNTYNFDDIDSKFLGYRIDRRKTKEGYLFSRNDNLGYIGLSFFRREDI
jgi:hypothetical protein